MTNEPMAVGKIPPEMLSSLLGRAGALPPEVLLGPAIGEDACAVTVESGVLVAAADPVTITARDIGRHAVIVNANDVAVTGVRPRWFLATVMLPPGSTPADLARLFEGLHSGLAEVGAVLVGGHTEVTDAVVRPVVAGQMLGLAEDGHIVRTGGLRAGDVVVQVGSAPVEGAAVLAIEAAERLAGLAASVLSAALSAIDEPGISVVEPALAAAAMGATALHDPTEGGIATGLHEMSSASGVAIRVDRSRVLWFGPGLAVCAALGADPWGTLASGTVLAGFAPARAPGAIEALTALGWSAAIIGTAEPGSGVSDLSGDAITLPVRDEVSRVLSGPPG